MPESRFRFTVAEWMLIVALTALILAHGTWASRHEGPHWQGVGGALGLFAAGATVIWLQIRPIPAGRNELPGGPGPLAEPGVRPSHSGRGRDVEPHPLR
jgi:hypothetical protein